MEHGPINFQQMARQIIISPLILLVFFTSLPLISPTTSQKKPIFLGDFCNFPKGNYTENSPYNSNLLEAFSNLTSLSSFNTFSNFTVGTDEDASNKVYALYNCRLDVTLQRCHKCIEDATKNLLQICHPSIEASIIYEECMLRYANRPIFALMELLPYYFHCDTSIPDGGELNRTVEPIFKQLIDEATSGNSSRYFAVGEGRYFEYQKVYCLVQCTPDIRRDECKECLTLAMNNTLQQCTGDSRLLGMFIVPSCQLRYDIVPFYNLSSSLSPMASPPALSPHIRTSDGGQLLVTIKTLFVFLSFFFCLM